MIWWEVEGEAIDIPSGEVDASSSSESSSSARHETSVASVVGGETVQSLEEMNQGGATTSQAASSTQLGANGGDSFDRTITASHEGSTSQTSDGLTRTASSHFESSAETHEERSTEAGLDGDDYRATVYFSQTIQGGWTREATVEQHATFVTVTGTGLDTTTVTSSSSTIGTTLESSTWLDTTTNSTTISKESPGSAMAQTSCTYEQTIDGTTTATGAVTATLWTTEDGEALTTTATRASTITASTTLTQEGLTTTITTGTMRAGYLRNTVILADCGKKLLVASARAGEEQGHARDWFTDQGTSYLAAQDVGATFADLSSDTTASSSTSFADASTDEATIFGLVVLRTFNTESEAASSLEGSTQQTEGRLVPNEAGWPVGWRAASWEFDFPPPGESGALSILYTGAITLIVTLNPGLGGTPTVTTLEDREDHEGTWTFEPGIDVHVDDCQAFSPDAFAEGQFYPFYVAEVNCRPHA